MNALDAAWFSGFADGEGCFSLQRVNRRTPRPVFSIRLRADDAYVLDWCCSEFAVGIVYYNDPKQGSVNVLGKITAQSKPQAMWTVARKVETLRLMQHFDAFPLRSSKKRDYEIWREMVLEYNKSPKMRDHGLLVRLAHALSEVKKYQNTDIAIPSKDWAQLGFESIP